ncbi:hypothetical protein [Oceanobacillus sp. 1P07AA]|uniref:hypothetical protein n=1 Tax=Oceanobacillus sp. 1P07AA TaxID=3132293 RepID=UPI0039A52ED7
MGMSQNNDSNQIKVEDEIQEITSVTYKSVMKVVAYLYFPFFLLIITIMLFRFSDLNEDFSSVWDGLLSIFLMIGWLLVFYVLISLIMAFFYNFFAKKFGGLEIRMKDKD